MLFLLSAADEVKYLLIGKGLMQEGVAAHIVSSITAGLAVATTTNPLDLVKSRYMNQEFDKVRTRAVLDSSRCRSI
jgi:solute carrier family 25 protein 14/30